MKKHSSLFILAPCMVLLLCAHAAADDFHYNNVLIGDRASGLGGAYTAVSDDAAGLFYNPAGIVYSSGRNLSASVNAYYNLTKTYKSAIAGLDWKRESSVFLPNFFGIIQPLGKFKVGFSYAVPDSISEDQDQTFYNITVPTSLNPIDFTLNFNNDDKTYNLGPSVALEIATDFSAGLTLYVHYRSVQTISNTIAIDNVASTYELQNSYWEAEELGVKPILGFMWSPTETVALGLAVSKTFLIDADATIQGTCTTDSPLIGCGGVGLDFVRAEYSSDAKRKYPLNVTAGVAYFPSSRFLLSGDVSYHQKLRDDTFTDRETVLNFALGAEYFMSKKWAVRGGLFTDFASTPEIDPAAADQPEHIDLYGGSLSISYFTRNTSLTLGGSMSVGDGEAQIRRGLTEVQDADETAWTLFLSSSYSY